ncbi:hypothetical protein BST26_14190 [Mycolicibacterium insubricum]|uniref:DUF5642 domain-containing protein n=1 Tax=Mycolicibacterium insubricum TaxID=444597 RepID=A0A1X0D8C0_9MYCO|nr:hypothetical protein BST26_14190 [Mycolicibacterium insubricum]
MGSMTGPWDPQAGGPSGNPWPGQPGAPQPGPDQPGDPSAQYPPGWQPAPGTAPPPAAKGRSTKFWLIGGGVVFVVAAVVIAMIAVLTATKSKPDITDLTASMLLTENEFPSVDGGRYKQRGVKSVDEESTDRCPWGGKGQTAQATLDGSGKTREFRTMLALIDPTPDPAAAPRCVSSDAETINVTGLPSGVVAVSDPQDASVELTAVGLVRGVLVAAEVHNPDNSMDQAKSDLVAVYNAQANKLNKA